ETGEGDGRQGVCFPRQRLPAPPPSSARPSAKLRYLPHQGGGGGAVFGTAPRHSRVALMAFSPQISPLERFALRDRSKPIKGRCLRLPHDPATHCLSPSGLTRGRSGFEPAPWCVWWFGPRQRGV